MTSRAGQPDTDADRELRALLDAPVLRPFIMVAGAGSGKTTSLVKALDHIEKTKGSALRNRGQQVACITFTEVAVNEIWSDVGNASLFHVSTIHSFLWSVVRAFQVDIRAWVQARIGEKIAEAEERIAKQRTQDRTRVKLREDVARYRQQIGELDRVRRFAYGTGSDYAKGILGHSDVLTIGPALMTQSELLRKIIVARFPYIFVDESQDTDPEVVTALRQLVSVPNAPFCLGFFGDPMQKIYTTGAGAIVPEPEWGSIKKPENFRCPVSVLSVINGIRSEDDRLVQVRGRTVEQEGEHVPVEGTARLFLYRADDQRTERLAEVRRWIAETNADPLWVADDNSGDVRVLVIVHRMAARRLGFPGLYSALNDHGSHALKDGLVDGTAWVVRPFLKALLPLVTASQAGDAFAVISILRSESPLLASENLTGANAAEVLRQLQAGVERLVAMLDPNAESKFLDVLKFVKELRLIELDERFDPFLDDPAGRVVNEEEEGIEAAVRAFLACRAGESWGYSRYIENQSPFATQQGIKGAEFQRVLVVLDDEEGSYNLFSYEKYFGIAPLSPRDEENIAAGVDSVISRTRRLFYVCCSRAVQDLSVVFFVPNVEAAHRAIVAKNFFRPENIYAL
jgi:DNA helicase II / ATP-dependent DNA helicase PcrA